MKKRIAILAFIIVFMAGFFYLQNNWLTITKLELTFEKLPESFQGFRIVQISDLHSKSFGKDQKRLEEILITLKPDIVVITGDIVDGRHYDEEPPLELVRKAVKIAPVYYVTGNHEWWSGKFSSLEPKLKEAGAIVLRNEWKELKVNDQKIYIVGIDDPTSVTSGYNEAGFVTERLQEILSKVPGEGFKILLSHRPEKLLQYSSFNIDLVFSGHAHGGQFRLPFIGGIIAPQQGFFPKYTSGIHKDKSTVMVISRGLGNSIIPQRIFNRPEVVQVTLKK